jgi:hypothetical protein
MNPINQLRFAVSDRIDDIDVSPSHVSLALLGEFQKDVSDFLRGSNRDVDPSKVLVSIENGSLSMVASELLLAASMLWTDLEHLKVKDSLSLIDPKRAKIVEHWQSEAQKNPHRRYLVADQTSQVSFFSVDSTSDFHKMEDLWVHVEKYLYGNVVDIGGSTSANVHLKLENEATVLTIAATKNLLKQGEQNRLYRPALLHITAEENLITGDLRNYKLVKFEDYQPGYDEDEFKLMVKRGTKAWADVADATEWLETLRGNHA